MIEELAEKYYTKFDYNCAETVLHAADEAYGLGLSEDAFKVIGGFGGGCGCGNLCGAVAGAIGAIGKIYIRTRAHDTHGIGEKCAAFLAEYKERMGSELCSVLKPKYNVDERKCLPVILAAVRVLDEVLSEESHAHESKDQNS